MSRPASGSFDTGQHEVVARPYPGGRAQAESGSKIVENDYNAWKAISTAPPALPAGHLLILRFGRAWHAVSALGLGDDAGAASIRYRVLAYAARLLGSPTSEAGRGREAGALLNLWRHALIHGQRLYATGLDRFVNSGASGRYAGYAQAVDESVNIEKRYQMWQEAAGADPGLAEYAALLRKAWDQIEQHGPIDGPAAAAERYHALAEHAHKLSDDPAQLLPPVALTPLLKLAMHADKHSIRLDNTAFAINSGGPAPYRGLPLQVAATTAHGHTEMPHTASATAPAGEGLTARAAQQRSTREERER